MTYPPPVCNKICFTKIVTRPEKNPISLGKLDPVRQSFGKFFLSRPHYESLVPSTDVRLELLWYNPEFLAMVFKIFRC